MHDCVNKTSLRFIFAFMVIIALSLGFFEFIHRLQESATATSSEELLAEPETEIEIE